MSGQMGQWLLAETRGFWQNGVHETAETSFAKSSRNAETAKLIKIAKLPVKHAISSFFLKEICDFQLSLEVEYVANFWLSLEAEYANFQLSLEVCKDVVVGLLDDEGIIEENARHDAENTEYKIRIKELEKHNANILAENVELKAELAKLKYDFDLSNFIKSQQA
ncbi:hypothetical protein RhiirA5_420375 [Rhizophagus irregularis]|uniref:Uncharacterized protein n=1 Tax=Rhizophagus irregularis TaxID=588596 RepID=A0A2N0PGA8_9GLOM|nr:hypothetical protein RhiirA5_420375 [Rhizophagus irregularis]